MERLTHPTEPAGSGLPQAGSDPAASRLARPDTRMPVQACASPPAPREGDVVVARNPGSPLRFTLRQVPSDVQFGATTQQEAVDLARSYAQKQSVDVWFAEAESLRLVEEYRGKRAAGRGRAR